VNFDIAGSGYSIRPARPGDAKALRMLLPPMTRTAVNLVAVDNQHQLVIGAAAATRAQRPQPLVGPGIAVHVIDPCRRHGIGKDLVDRLALAARSAGAKALYSAKRVELDSDEMRGWRGLGFTTCETVEQHRLPLQRLEPQLEPLIDRIRQRGRMPPTARIIPLYQADLSAVLQLHLDNMGGDRGDLSRRIRGQGSNAFLPQYSRVLVVDDQVKGCLLGHRKDAVTMVIDAVIVDPGFRGGWANVWLKLDAARGVRHLGIENLEYTTFDHYDDTRSFTKKLGGVTIGTSVLMFRPIARAASGARDAGG
jgi:N-acetylglutamate synthase-like GNAT family acetyltransferase